MLAAVHKVDCLPLAYGELGGHGDSPYVVVLCGSPLPVNTRYAHEHLVSTTYFIFLLHFYV